MTVHIDRGQLRYFRDKARHSKNEIMALLMGNIVSEDKVEVVYFDYPRIDFATTASVSADPADEVDATYMAEEAGFQRLGTIHSHPGSPAYMSMADRKSHLEDGDLISGIVEICGGRSRVAFWEANNSVPCAVEYFKGKKKK